MTKEIRTQRIQKPDAKKQPIVVNEKRDNLLSSMAAPKMSEDILRTINAPVRTVIYVEVGDSTPMQMRELLSNLNKAYEGNEGGIHYIVPVRGGKLRTDIQFEQEFLETIRNICEVRDGKIEFKDDYSETIIIRETV